MIKTSYPSIKSNFLTFGGREGEMGVRRGGGERWGWSRVKDGEAEGERERELSRLQTHHGAPYGA